MLPSVIGGPGGRFAMALSNGPRPQTALIGRALNALDAAS